MSLSLSDARDETNTVTVEFGSQSFDVTYRPNVLTPQLEAELRSGDPERNDGFIRLFTEIVADWDVKTSAKGKKVPVTPEGLEAVPYSILREVLEAVVGEIRGNAQSGEPSVAS